MQDGLQLTTNSAELRVCAGGNKFAHCRERGVTEEGNVAVLPSNSPSKWGLARAVDKGYSPDSGNLLSTPCI
jgi:hypothetical protein